MACGSSSRRFQRRRVFGWSDRDEASPGLARALERQRVSGCRRAGARSDPTGSVSSTRCARPVMRRLRASHAACSSPLGNEPREQRDWLRPAHAQGSGAAWMRPRLVLAAEVDRRRRCPTACLPRERERKERASPKRETAPGEPMPDAGPRRPSRGIGSERRVALERARRHPSRSMEGALGRKVANSLHGDSWTVVSADAAENGARAPSLAGSVTEVSEVDQLSLYPRGRTRLGSRTAGVTEAFGAS
jgi:hypothetical protein